MLTYIWDGTSGDRVHVTAIGGIRGYACPEHRHRGFWELTLVRRGRLRHQVAGVWHESPPGALVLLREHDAHALAGEGVEYLNVSFDLTFIHRLEPALRSLLDGEGPVHLHLSPARAAAVEAETDAIAAAAGELRVILMVRLLAGVAADIVARQAAPPAAPPWLERLRERLERSDLPVPSLHEVRLHAGVSAEHLARTVQRHLGAVGVVASMPTAARCTVAGGHGSVGGADRRALWICGCGAFSSAISRRARHRAAGLPSA
jgi:hypothetical protein